MLENNDSDKGEFCCPRMKRQVGYFEDKKLDINGRSYGNIWYDRQYRRYGILDYCGDWNDVIVSGIYYCPYCGTKLQMPFEDEVMEEILRKEFHWSNEDCWNYPRRELPEEFKTDEWWKKRGL